MNASLGAKCAQFELLLHRTISKGIHLSLILFDLYFLPECKLKI